MQLYCNTLWETAGKIVHLNIDTSAMSHVTGGATKKSSLYEHPSVMEEGFPVSDNTN